MTRCLHRERKPRRCKSRGCGTWLSSANPTGHCSVHGGWRRVTGSSSKERSGRGDDLADLMAA